MNCPFCGVETDVAHETQQGCIDALRSEILRVRDILQNVRTFDVRSAREVTEDRPAATNECEVEPLF
jgi:hypothetical protein